MYKINNKETPRILDHLIKKTFPWTSYPFFKTQFQFKKDSLWVLLIMQFSNVDQKLGLTFQQMKKKKLNLNYLMLKANENIFKLLFLLKAHLVFNDKVFCFLQVSCLKKQQPILFFIVLIIYSNAFINSTIILLYYWLFLMILFLMH